MANNRKLGRATDHRMAMLRALVTYLLENGKVETTLARAKEVGPLTEKMITLGKKNPLASRRQAMAFVTKEAVVASCALRSLQSTLTATVATPASSRPARVVATQLKWRSSSWLSKLNFNF